MNTNVFTDRERAMAKTLKLAMADAARWRAWRGAIASKNVGFLDALTNKLPHTDPSEADIDRATDAAMGLS